MMKLFRVLWLALMLLGPCAIAMAQEAEPGADPAPTEQPAEPAGDEAPEPPPDPEPAEQAAEPTTEELPPVEEQPATEEAPAEAAPPDVAAEIIPRDYLTLPAVGNYGKAAIHTDPIDAQISSGNWKSPVKGDEVKVPGGVERHWKDRQASETGILDTSDLHRGYTVTTFESPEERVMVLHASGHALVYVNGEPRTGDIYSYGWVELPVLVRKGTNELLFQAAGDTLTVKLTMPASGVYFLAADTTLPDLVEGESEEKWAAIPVVNATQETFTGHLSCSVGDASVIQSPLPTIPPLSVFKAPVRIPALTAVTAEKVALSVAIHPGSVPPMAEGNDAPEAAIATPEKLSEAQLTLDTAAAGTLHTRTFRSAIDGSIQSYAVLPAGGEDPTWEGTPGIMLTLHGAGVDASKHAGSYKPKRWAHLVAPNNRRPYGFDWEDWGRIDAIEALVDAEKRFPNDPLRRYVTGHSMGGHGAWHLGVTFPGRFAAIAPSAGWPSFWSYGGGMPHFENPTPVEEMLLRGYSPSDTMKLLRNLAPVGTYLLHGEKDDNVPVTQARFMRSKLGDFHPDFAYYEQRDAGHWWGDECVDWPWLMQFLRNHKLPGPGGPAEIDFTTANPGVSSRCHWAAIEAQQTQLQPSRIVLDQTPTERRITGRTENVDRLMLDLSHFPPGNMRVQLDGTDSTRVRMPRGDDKRVWLVKRDDRWRQIPNPPARLKGPNRYGAFKSAFDNRVMLVYGTKGTSEENQWALAKARFDAETFWYRGNGAIEVVADTAFKADDDPDCNVILYGNSETNAAWPALLSLCPVQVRKGQVAMSLRPETGDDLGILFCWPRQGSDNALVGVVGGTGIQGMRLTTRLRYFVSGVAYPDFMLFGPNVLTEGTEDIRAIGYFGNDWKVDSGEIVWRDVAL